jgi:ABC-type nitrate/sulfonate/bicarbonate transport system substrate-binding protein
VAQLTIATPDLVTNSYFPALAAEELGLYREQGLDAHVELLPSLDAVNALRDGTVDFVAGGAHTTLLAFPGWKGAKLAVALSQGTPWLLVLRADLPARRGDVSAVKGLRIGAAPGPDRAFLRLLHEAGVDPVRDGVQIAPVPGGTDPGASFGVTAAAALERGLVDGFWANALGSETAVRRGVGKIVVDVRRGDGPPEAGQYTFAALSTTDALIAREPERVAAAVRAIVGAERSAARSGAGNRGGEAALPAGRGGDHRGGRRARSSVLRSGDRRARGLRHERLRPLARPAGSPGRLRRHGRHPVPRPLGPWR